ncbi:Palmitoyltransferase ZDHHC2 [Trichinella nativa]|uniref:Palmitoyltransferase n=1 Tax=Trichinella nativa TaxID=6335 RepID=A0A0V1LH09_9BILA|nr:Palmitoyltransferase ZDHHC2 [Trichinella nativa]
MGLSSCMRNPVVVFCLQLFRWVPVVFISVVVLWSYYAYVFELCFFSVQSYIEKGAVAEEFVVAFYALLKILFRSAVYLIPYHLIVILFMWSYWKTIFSTVYTAPPLFSISSSDVTRLRQGNLEATSGFIAELTNSLPVRCRNKDGGLRYCEKCQIIKPDRAHHCSICGICLLKMDHHCPWVNTCVHFGNYKFFILFLGYAWIMCLFIALTDLKYFVAFWTDEGRMQKKSQFHIMFLFFVACMFFFSVSSLFSYHLWLTSKNRTTLACVVFYLESFRAPIFSHGPDKEGFNLGTTRNFREIFGDSPFYWLIPVFSSRGDGVSFPLARDQTAAYHFP